MSKELEILYKETLNDIRKKEAELEKQKNLLTSLESKLIDYLQEHKGKFYKLGEKHVAFDTAAFWKKNFPKIHEACSVVVKTKRFELDLLKENYPNKYRRATKIMEPVILEK